MYYPYLRGKQFELLLLRENAKFIKDNNIHPIIEPVNTNLKAIERALNELNNNEVNYVLIINPMAGKNPVNQDHIISNLWDDYLKDNDNVNLGLLIDAKTKLKDIENFLKRYSNKHISIIHYGFTDGKELGKLIKNFSQVDENIYIEEFSRKMYRNYIAKEGVKNILIRDGFKSSKKNADYPEIEHFSELHATYKRWESMDGFGDFLIVGEKYSETGGPAYAVAIHLTYIEDNDMYIYHFISDETQTQTDPGGKFLEALTKLVTKLTDKKTNICKTRACAEYKQLYKRKHYPGLGYVKKLSMQHHLELIADYLKNERD